LSDHGVCRTFYSVSLDIRCRAGLSSTRFEADPQGLRLDGPSGHLELPWSAVLRVSVLPLRWGRAAVIFDLRDGSQLRPVALRSAEAGVAREVERLWNAYGPPAASAMWGRSPRSERSVVTG
jgi:hypothetical protein